MILQRNNPVETKVGPQVACPHCSVAYTIMNVSSAGAKVQCQYCGTMFMVNVVVTASAEKLPILNKTAGRTYFTADLNDLGINPNPIRTDAWDEVIRGMEVVEPPAAPAQPAPRTTRTRRTGGV